MNTPSAIGAARLRVASRLRKRQGERAAAKAHRGPAEAVEQAEELQRHGDHEQPGDDGQNPLRGVERAVGDGTAAPWAVQTAWPSAPASAPRKQ